MFYFTNISEERLKTCHVDLQTICRTVIQGYKFAVICGHRDEQAQNEAFGKGTSKVKFPDSKHNQLPSLAVDLAPLPIDWNDLKRFHELAGHILEVAHLLGINVEWGGHWQTWKDYPHYQVKNIT